MRPLTEAAEPVRVSPVSAMTALRAYQHGKGDFADCLVASRAHDAACSTVISSVNLAEVVGKLADAGMPGDQIELALSSLGLRVAPLNEGAACAVGMVRPATRAKGLSLGDRACLVLGVESGLPVLTADCARAELELGATVEAIR